MQENKPTDLNGNIIEKVKDVKGNIIYIDKIIGQGGQGMVCRSLDKNLAVKFVTKGDKIIVRVEVPGNSRIESKIDYIGEYSVIILTGNKKYDKEPEKFEDNIYNSREFGNFELNIVLRTNEYLLKNEQPKIIKKNGVLLLEYSLVKTNKAELETKSDEEIYNL